MSVRLAAAAALSALALAGCATTGSGPTDVSRYHIGAAFPPGPVAVRPMTNASIGASPEFALYGDAVSAELARLGYAPGAAPSSATYYADVAFQRTSQGTYQTPPRFSIGIGGGSFGGGRRGGGVGLGGGVSTGFGSKTREIWGSELWVQLRRRSDNVVVWEGRAQRPGIAGRAEDQPVAVAQRLAAALFQGFPGESGISTTVK